MTSWQLGLVALSIAAVSTNGLAETAPPPPVVVDHIDFGGSYDRGRVLLAGEDALVLDGNSPVLLRWTADCWSVADASLRGAPALRPGAFSPAFGWGMSLIAEVSRPCWHAQYGARADQTGGHPCAVVASWRWSASSP